MGASLHIMGATSQPLLSHGMSASVTARNSGPGSISIEYPLSGTRADQLAAGLLVRARVSASGRDDRELAPYVLQDFDVDEVEDPSGNPVRIGKWDGFQAGWYDMLGSLTHDNYFPGGIEPYRRLAGNPGQVMRSVEYYAHARGELSYTGVSIEPNSPTDTGGDPWIADYDQSIDCPWDTDATKPLLLMVEDFACEWDLSAARTFDSETPGFDSYLRLFNPGNMGTDLTSVMGDDKPLIIKTGVGVTSAPLRQSLGPNGVIGRVLAYNKNGLHVIVEADDIDPDHVRTLGLSFPDVIASSTLERKAIRALNANRKIHTEQSVELDLSGDSGLPVPGLDVIAGDHLYLDTRGRNERRRCAEWSLKISDKGKVTGGLVMDEMIKGYVQRFDRGIAENRRQITLNTSGAYL